jgi:initiation factor 1A
MVKNTFGGGKAKGYARKNENSVSTRLRMIEDDAEKYGIVRKIFGGSICEVFCSDQITRQGVIRGKFRGKGKRNSIISSGTVVLIGLREWATQVKSDKLEQGDILEVYSAFELDQLKQKPSFPVDFLESSMHDNSGPDKPDGFNFSTIEEDSLITYDTSNIDIINSFIPIDIDDI